jgi:hypothetical protein
MARNGRRSGSCAKARMETNKLRNNISNLLFIILVIEYYNFVLVFLVYPMTAGHEAAGLVGVMRRSDVGGVLVRYISRTGQAWGNE